MTVLTIFDVLENKCADRFQHSTVLGLYTISETDFLFSHTYAPEWTDPDLVILISSCVVSPLHIHSAYL